MLTYKIIACDMDETLLSSDASICRRNIEAIAKAKAQGVKFVPCSAATPPSAAAILKPLQKQKPRASNSCPARDGDSAPSKAS